ncbi:integrin beta-like protein 1 [Elysia marginata]|uniref:Integrin beta-like protein 1 n=1 Tax=Elysia marginata TaxID=1093978 RepID=A0AAV4J8E2_9GAST|nr:integrin beta-like protein 1 [Elysia marginata]
MAVNKTCVFVVLMAHLFSVIESVASCSRHGADTTCCACVSSPGCSWFSPPGSHSGYCNTSPYLLSGGSGAAASSFPAWSQGGTVGVFPSQPVEISVTRNEPFHLGQRRLLRPQDVRLKVAVGVRAQVMFRLTSSVIVSGPIRATNGDVEFGLRPADDTSCSRGLGRLGRDTSSYPRRRAYSCRGDGPGMVHSLLLDVDVKRCLTRVFTLRVLVRDSGTRSRSLRVRVRSACDCPSCHGSRIMRAVPRGIFGIAISTTPSTQPQLCDVVSCGTGVHATISNVLSPEATVCLRRGVNERCMPACDHQDRCNVTRGQTCSGRGLCVCGECSCRPRRELFPAQRFTGTYCECDDYSCPASQDGMLCGGPGRGACHCGQCQCHEGWVGDACEASIFPPSHCVAPSSDDGSVCSGRGTCMEGLCECPWPYSGQFCQCNDLSCPRHLGLMCGGHGQCVCGQCECNALARGDACQETVLAGKLSQDN